MNENHLNVSKTQRTFCSVLCCLYNQARIHRGRERARHLGGTRWRVITFVTERGRCPGRQGVAQSLGSKDEQNWSATSDGEEVISVTKFIVTQHTKNVDVLAICQEIQVHTRLSEGNRLMTVLVPSWVLCCCSISRNTLTACIDRHRLFLNGFCSCYSGTSSHFGHCNCTEMPLKWSI